MSRSRLTRSSRPRLDTYLGNELAGVVFEFANRKLVFRYDLGWRERRGAYPLSLSMALETAEHGHQVTWAFLAGLLPENDSTLQALSRHLDISPNNVTEMLANVGRDCAGAVRFVRSGEDPQFGTRDQQQHIRWLSREEVAAELKLAKRPTSTMADPMRLGQFSLAGAQPKIALYRDHAGNYGVPLNGSTNTILKPPVLKWRDLVHNEHLCLQLARNLGIAAASSTIEMFDDEIAIVVDRYDRIEIDGAVRRIHQEDMCQSLAVLPTQKYESDGGPGVSAMAGVLMRHSSRPEVDVKRFIDAVAFNWLIHGVDAHAKNHSILISAGPQVRFAPLYDLVSALVYPEITEQNPLLPVSIGGERHIDNIGLAQWKQLAADCALNEDMVITEVRRIVECFPDALHKLSTSARNDASTSDFPGEFADAVERHVGKCRLRLV